MKTTLLSAAVLVGFATVVFAGPGGQPPIKVGPIAVVGQQDIGTCNNVWALDSFNKFYTITVNKGGTYNVQVNYKDGTFVTGDFFQYDPSMPGNAGPGACKTGAYDGSTVDPGITGRTHQEYNGTVIGTLSGAACDATCVDTTSILNKLFSPGWTWVILPDGGHWSWVGYYEAGNNGTWFDTSVNWPYNDRGNIAGSP